MEHFQTAVGVSSTSVWWRACRQHFGMGRWSCPSHSNAGGLMLVQGASSMLMLHAASFSQSSLQTVRSKTQHFVCHDKAFRVFCSYFKVKTKQTNKHPVQINLLQPQSIFVLVHFCFFFQSSLELCALVPTSSLHGQESWRSTETLTTTDKKRSLNVTAACATTFPH